LSQDLVAPIEDPTPVVGELVDERFGAGAHGDLPAVQRHDLQRPRAASEDLKFGHEQSAEPTTPMQGVRPRLNARREGYDAVTASHHADGNRALVLLDERSVFRRVGVVEPDVQIVVAHREKRVLVDIEGQTPGDSEHTNVADGFNPVVAQLSHPFSLADPGAPPEARRGPCGAPAAVSGWFRGSPGLDPVDQGYPWWGSGRAYGPGARVFRGVQIDPSPYLKVGMIFDLARNKTRARQKSTTAK